MVSAPPASSPSASSSSGQSPTLRRRALASAYFGCLPPSPSPERREQAARVVAPVPVGHDTDLRHGQALGAAVHVVERLVKHGLVAEKRDVRRPVTDEPET